MKYNDSIFVSQFTIKQSNSMSAILKTVEINANIDQAGAFVPVLVTAWFYENEDAGCGGDEDEDFFQIVTATWSGLVVTDQVRKYYTEQIWSAYLELQADTDAAAYEDYQLSLYATEEKAYC